MKVYVGQTRGETLIKLLTELGWGEMTSRGELYPRRTPWAFDNGAFPDWTAGRPFNERAFMDDVERNRFENLAIHFLLDTRDLIVGHWTMMSEIESKAVRCHQ